MSPDFPQRSWATVLPSARVDEGAHVPDFPAITHVALTVSDLDRSREWYGRLIGTRCSMKMPERSITWCA